MIAAIVSTITPSDWTLGWLKISLGIGLVLSNVFVWRGVYLENDNFSPDVKERGWIMLVRALAAEAVIGGLILITDAEISRRQETKIIALATRLAPRILNDAGKERFSSLRGKVSALAFMATGGIEPAMYSGQIQAELGDHDGIQIRPYPSNPSTLTMGIQICFPSNYDFANKTLVLATFTEDGHKPGDCKFENFDPGLPQDIPLVVIGERPFVYLDTQDPSSIRIKCYPEPDQNCTE